MQVPNETRGSWRRRARCRRISSDRDIQFSKSFRWIGGIMLFSLFMPGAYAACEVTAGSLVSKEGRVEVKRSADSQWSVAVLNGELCQGDTVRAGDNSRAAIALANQAVLRVDENTTIQLLNVTPEKEKRSVIGLIKGAFQSFSRKPRGFEVNTPYLNGSIEGTEFVLRVAENETVLTVLEGRVKAANDQGEISVGAGESVAAAAGQAPQPRTIVRPRDAAQWALHYPPVLSTGSELSEGAPPYLSNAITASSKGDTPAALGMLNDVAEADRDAKFHLYRAAMLLNVGRVAAAQSDIDKAVTMDAGAGLAYALKAVIAVARNERELALTDAKKGVELAPKLVATNIALSYALQSQFKIADARDVMAQATKHQPKDALAWARLAELQLMLGNRSKAGSAAREASKLAPDLGRTQTVLGYAALARFRTGTAKKAFMKAVELNSSDPMPHLGLGLVNINNGHVERGRKQIEVAVGLDSGNALLRAYLGKAYFEEERTGLDAQQLEIAKQLDPLDPTAWLYEGIRLQSHNQPVEAIQQFEQSIDRNENRAAYRGRLLLDKDRASRGTSLANAYSALGFNQAGTNEAARSLVLDPANNSAHRFLADTYRSDPRLEIGRTSEQLQAQLLQDININPVSPSLAETGLNIANAGGPSQAGINEFTSLFQRDQAQLSLSGFAGNQGTSGNEVAASGLYDRVSVSVGAYSYDSDGFRDNNDLSHRIYNGFLQIAVTPEINIQAERKSRTTENGDIVFDFDPEDYSDNYRQERESVSDRFGIRWNISKSSTLVLSDIVNRRTEEGSLTDTIVPGFVFIDTNIETESDGTQQDLQYLFTGERFNVTAGYTRAFVTSENVNTQVFTNNFLPPPFNITTTVQEFEPETTDTRYYIYSNWHFPRSMTWTVGVASQSYVIEETRPGQESEHEIDQISPKVGMQWDITKSLRARAAYFKAIKPALTTNQTLEPTQVAGFNQFYDDPNGSKSTRYGAGLDWRAHRDAYLGAEASRRVIEHFERVGTELEFSERDELLHRVYAYWTPSRRVSVSAEAIFDDYKSSVDDITRPREVSTYSVPVRIRYFSPSGIFAGIGSTWVEQKVERFQGVIPEWTEVSSSFYVIDLTLGARLGRRGTASFSVSNVMDRDDIEYQDNTYRTYQDVSSASPYTPGRKIMARFALSF